jgi:hypothetical protein
MSRLAVAAVDGVRTVANAKTATPCLSLTKHLAVRLVPSRNC